MSAEMRSFMEAYQAVHNKEAKENLEKGRDSISEMNLSQLTDGDLCEIAEEVLEVMFADGKGVADCEAIVESILTSSTNPGRQAKIERLQESFKKVFGTVKEKSARTAVESYAMYRKGKSLQDNWSRKFSHENGNVRLHNSLVAEDRAVVKNGLLELYKGKHGQTEKQYADSRSPGGKMVSGDSKQSGAEYTHGRRVKAANPGMQPDVGGKTKPKSQGKMDAGTRADLQYRKANLKKEEYVDEAITSEKGKAKMKAMLDARTTASGRAKAGKGENVAQIKHIGRANVDGYGGTPPNRKVAKNPVKSNFTGLKTGSGNKAAKRAAALKKEDFELWVNELVEEGYDLSDYTWDEMYDIYEADSIAAMRERAAKRREQRYGKSGGGGRDDFRPYTKADYERGEKKSAKEEVEVSQIRKDWADAYAEVYVAEKKGDGNLANNYPPYDKVTRADIIAGATGKDQMGGKNIRGNDSKEQKARLEKKRGMKLDDHPQFKEELEATGKFTAQEIEAIINKI